MLIILIFVILKIISKKYNLDYKTLVRIISPLFITLTSFSNKSKILQQGLNTIILHTLHDLQYIDMSIKGIVLLYHHIIVFLLCEKTRKRYFKKNKFLDPFIVYNVKMSMLLYLNDITYNIHFLIQNKFTKNLNKFVFILNRLIIFPYNLYNLNKNYNKKNLIKKYKFNKVLYLYYNILVFNLLYLIYIFYKPKFISD